jgi:hypothetical protein
MDLNEARERIRAVDEEMAGAMFETFVINEILKSYSNEGLDYDFDVFYYNGKDKKKKTTRLPSSQ